MKFKPFITAFLITLTLGLPIVLNTGCQHTATGQLVIAGQVVTPQAVQAAATVGAKIAARAEMQHDPSTTAYFQAGVVILDTALANGNYDPSLLKTSLANMSVKEVKNPTVANAVGDVLDLVNAEFGSGIGTAIAKQQYLQAVLAGIDNGIRQALGMAKAVVTSPPPAITPN